MIKIAEQSEKADAGPFSNLIIYGPSEYPLGDKGTYDWSGLILPTDPHPTLFIFFVNFDSTFGRKLAIKSLAS